MDPIAAEKLTAMLRYSCIQKITALLRCLELFAVAAALLWSSSHLPAAARYSADLLRLLLSVLLGPRFLFLLGNAIVLILLLKSRRSKLTAGDPDDVAIANIGYEIPASFARPAPAAAIDPPPEAVLEEKKSCIEERAPPPTQAAAPARERAYRRRRSERMGEWRRGKGSWELRRAKTDVRKVVAEDAEEFRRTIEAFIKKQWKFQREESKAVLTVCSASTPMLFP